MPKTMEILDKDFKKGTKYTNETVAQLLETTPKKTGDTEVYLLNHTVTTEDGGADIKSDSLRAPSATTNSNELSAQLMAFDQPNHDNFKVGGVFLSGSGNGNHFIGAVFDAQSKTLTILNPLSPDNTRSPSYTESITKIEEAFIGKFGEASSREPNKGITIKHNPKGKVLHQNDVVSCGPASVYSVQSMLQGQEISADDEKGIKEEKGMFSSENGAEKLRSSQRQQIEEYNNEDNMSKMNDSELDDEEKRRTSQTHPAPGDEQEAENFIGSSEAITKLWQERDEELKKILEKGGYNNTPMVDSQGVTHQDTADELIKHYNILTDETEEAGKARAAIYEYNKKFSTKLAEAMSAAVKDKNGDKLDFSKPTIKIDTGNGKKIKLKVGQATSNPKLREITIPEKFEDDANFTMSIAFQDEHGRNMPKNGALYYQIRVENGKITSVSAPEMHQDNPPDGPSDGPFHAFAQNGKKVYPKVDIETIKRNLGRQAELAKDIVVDTSHLPLTIENLAKHNADNEKKERSSITSGGTAATESGSDNIHEPPTPSFSSESSSEQARPPVTPNGKPKPPPPIRSNSVSSASESGESEQARPVAQAMIKSLDGASKWTINLDYLKPNNGRLGVNPHDKHDAPKRGNRNTEKGNRRYSQSAIKAL